MSQWMKLAFRFMRTNIKHRQLLSQVSVLEAFNALDQDGDGKIGIRELHRAISGLGVKLKPKHVRAFVKLFDRQERINGHTAVKYQY